MVCNSLFSFTEGTVIGSLTFSKVMEFLRMFFTITCELETVSYVTVDPKTRFS